MKITDDLLEEAIEFHVAKLMVNHSLTNSQAQLVLADILFRNIVQCSIENMAGAILREDKKGVKIR